MSASTPSANFAAGHEPLPAWLRSHASPELLAAALLLLGTMAALIWANSPAGYSYAAFWHTEVGLRLGGTELSLSLHHLVNDGLMAFFFFIVGLEVKRELVLGELADRRLAMVPVLAAIMGLIVPALVFVLIDQGSTAASAWGMVISTDTAFLLGIVAILGQACPLPLRVFLLALAVVDDIGALAVIAVFYTEQLHLGFLALAAAGVGLMFALRWLKVWRGPAYLVLAALSWGMLYLSGVHATLLGVVIALITPAYRVRRAEVAEVERRTRVYLQNPHPGNAQAARLSIERSIPVGERLQALWRPWTDYLIIPLFALANAGVVLSMDALTAAFASPVTLGAVAGLVLGKPIGILLGCALAVGLKLGQLAPGIGKLHLAGGALLSGIGFTISLLIVELAIPDPTLADQARVGVLAASALAGLAGYALLRLARRLAPGEPAAVAELQPPVDAARDHILGPAQAPLTLVGFGDFDDYFQGWGTIHELRERFGDRFRYVYRHIPSPKHPNAYLAAEAAEAAAAQGKFWEMHDRLYQRTGTLGPADLLDHAAGLELDVPRFARELSARHHRQRVDQDLASAHASGIDASHSFFVNGQRYTGAHDAASLAAALLATAPDAVGLAPEGAHPVPASAPASIRLDDWNLADELSRLPPDMAETPDLAGDYPRLSDAQLALVEKVAQRRTIARGDVLCQPGEQEPAFYVLLSGAVAMIGHNGANGQRMVRVHRAGRFFGALDQRRQQRILRTAVALQAGEVLRIPVQQLGAMLAGDNELRDLLARTFMLREAIGQELMPDLCILAAADDPRTVQLQEWASRHGLHVRASTPTSLFDPPQAMARLGLAATDLPVVLMPDGTLLRRAEPADVERAYFSQPVDAASTATSTSTSP